MRAYEHLVKMGKTLGLQDGDVGSNPVLVHFHSSFFRLDPLTGFFLSHFKGGGTTYSNVFFFLFSQFRHIALFIARRVWWVVSSEDPFRVELIAIMVHLSYIFKTELSRWISLTIYLIFVVSVPLFIVPYLYAIVLQRSIFTQFCKEVC